MPTGQTKKTKYINVFSNEGKERMIVRLPGEEHSGRSYDLDDEDPCQAEVRANARRPNTNWLEIVSSAAESFVIRRVPGRAFSAALW